MRIGTEIPDWLHSRHRTLKRNLVQRLTRIDRDNEHILFYNSLGGRWTTVPPVVSLARSSSGVREPSMKSGLTCLILVGGLGTRLRSVLAGIPKPMARINERPLLEYLLKQVCLAGFTDVILCVGDKAEVIESHFADGRRYGVQIRYSRERELLGTAGALSHARHLIRSDPFVVMNGDSYCAVDFEGLVRQHQARNAIATIVITWVEDRARYGSVVLGPQDAIIRFSEKEETGGPGYINGGIYILNETVLERIPSGKRCSIEQDVFPSLVGHGLCAFKTSGMFIDIGIPSELKRAQKVFKDHLGCL